MDSILTVLRGLLNNYLVVIANAIEMFVELECFLFQFPSRDVA